jgi:glycosyltransferase involved in cell wall biosynthesis
LDADLIHVHFGIDAVDIWPAIRKLSLPMIVTLHGYDINISRAWWESGRGGWFRRRYPGQLLAIARDPRVYFVAVSEAIRKRAIEFGIPEEKIAVNYIGVDTGKFVRSGLPVTHRRKRILFVGRLVEKKGCIYLIRAFALVCKSIPDAELMIVGGGPLKGYLEKEAMALNLPVSFLGVLPSEGIKQQLADSRILCLPSVTAENGDAEGFGLVILEAQACGVPVVVSAIGGAKEGILNGQTGFDFAERDIEGLASKIVYMFSHDDVLQGMSDSAVSYVQKAFSIYPCTKALENYYSKVMKACQADGLHGAY